MNEARKKLFQICASLLLADRHLYSSSQLSETRVVGLLGGEEDG